MISKKKAYFGLNPPPPPHNPHYTEAREFTAIALGIQISIKLNPVFDQRPIIASICESLYTLTIKKNNIQRHDIDYTLFVYEQSITIDRRSILGKNVEPRYDVE
mgnify:CR=1 FL=1